MESLEKDFPDILNITFRKNGWTFKMKKERKEKKEKSNLQNHKLYIQMYLNI